MCILFIAIKENKDYPLIIAANRDEFHARPTTPSSFWPETPTVLAGRDLQANGTWMGVTRSGRVAALTNIRSPSSMRTDTQSRGALVSNWLTQEQTNSAQYLATLKADRQDFNGYNLVFGDIGRLQVYNNFHDSVSEISDGTWGLSNADLHTPWPKVTRGIERLSHYVSSSPHIHEEALFAILRDDTQAMDHRLPDTGVGYEWEKQLSSIFIQSPQYGTRTSTLLLVAANGQLTWRERTFLPSGEASQTQQFVFPISIKN